MNYSGKPDPRPIALLPSLILAFTAFACRTAENETRVALADSFAVEAAAEVGTLHARGRVVDVASGGPAEGVEVTAMSYWYDLRNGIDYATAGVATSSADGSFLLENLEEADLVIQARGEGYVRRSSLYLPMPYEIVPRQSPDLALLHGANRPDLLIRIERSRRVRGIVSRPEGGPAAAAVVTASAFDPSGTDDAVDVTLTDSEGRFELQNASRRELVLFVEWDDFDQRRTGYLLVDAGGDVQDLVVDLARNDHAVVRGRVFGPDGAPVPEVELIFLERRIIDNHVVGFGWRSVFALTDDQGHYEAPGVGFTRIEVMPPMFVDQDAPPCFSWDGVDIDPHDRRVLIDRPGDFNHDVHLVKPASIKGRAVLSDGATPARMVHLRATRLDRDEPDATTSTFNFNAGDETVGGFELAGLVAGARYRIEATRCEVAPDFSPARLEVEFVLEDVRAPASGLVIRLPKD